MQIVILAGGEGSRLRPLTSDTPKPLVRVLGEPVIKRLLSLLFTCGFREATIADYYLADKLEESLGSFSNGIKLSYVREDVPLGTAGCVRKAWNGKDDVLVVSGDSVCGFDFNKICRYHKKMSADVTIVTHKVADPREYGLVTADEKGGVIGFLEKPGYDSCLTDVANTGTYVISSDIIARIPKDEKTDFAMDVFPTLLKEDKRIFAYTESKIWHDIGDIPSLLKCQRELLQLEGKDRLILEGASVDESALVSAESVIEGGASVGAECRVQGSLILSGASLGEGSTVTNSVIGENVTTGRGCRFGELSAIGSGCVIGSAVTVDSGVRIENGVRIPSGAHIRSDVSAGGYKPLSFGDFGEAEGIEESAVNAIRLGMAISKALDIRDITLGYISGSESMAQAVSLGLRTEGTAVYSLQNAAFGETVFAARKLGTKYALYISEDVRLLRSDRIELARSEERRVEQSFNRGELRGDGNRRSEQGGMKNAPEINAEAASSLYIKELKRRVSAPIRAKITLKTDNMPEAVIFTKVFGDISRNEGENLEFFAASDRMSVFCSAQGRIIPYEKLVLIACRHWFSKRLNVRLPQRAPLSCDDYARLEGQTVTHVSASDDLELSPFSYDPLMLIADVLGYLADRSISLNAAAAELPEIVYTRRTVEVGEALPKILRRDFADLRRGRDIVLDSDGAKAYVRPLKSGRALAMYVESVSQEAANAVCDDIIKRLGISKPKRKRE